MFLDKIIKFLDDIGPLFYVIIPTLFGIYVNLRDKINSKKKEITDTQKAKNKELYKVWEHEESQRIIRKIKDLCDFYKDKGYTDRVQYVQLENGTVASSKLCNMFISCLAEDSRFGRLPHLISKLQRVPYSRVARLIDEIRGLDAQSFDNAVCISNVDAQEYDIMVVLKEETIKSSIIVPIFDPNEILLGACIFYYASPNYNNQNVKKEIALINRFRSSIQSIFLEYHIEREDKKKELGLIGGADND